MSPPTKRPRGRPRKHPLTKLDTDVQRFKQTKGEKDVDGSHAVNGKQKDRLKHLSNVVEDVKPVLYFESVEGNEISARKNSQTSVINEAQKCKGVNHCDILNNLKDSKESTVYLDKLQVRKDREKLASNNNDAQEQKDKPTVLRKFRPPKSKYQIEGEKKAKISEKPDFESGEIGVSTIHSSSSNFTGPSKTVSAVKEIIIDLSVEPSSESSEEVNIKYHTPNDEVYSKFIHINSWVARTDPYRSFKQTTSLEKMKTKEALVSTYKCMGRLCSFTTVSQRNFTKHLQYHGAAASEETFLHYCPYCTYKGTTAMDLIEHYRAHIYDKFQCGYCFYRSAVGSSCLEHVKTHHKRKSEKVYECPLETLPKYNLIADRILQLRMENIKPLKCSSCTLMFYLIDAYETHINTHSINVETMETAREDGEQLRKMLSNNQVGRFDCVYCSYATSYRYEFRAHMQEHPSENVYLCDRKNVSRANTVDPLSIESAVIFELPRPKDLKIIPFDIELNSLKNTLDIAKIMD